VLLEVIEFTAVVASALFGILLARKKQLDFVGVFSVAFVVAFGGGTLRDLFLDRHPLFWIDQGHYPVVVFVLALVGSALGRFFPARTERFLCIPDALGLGLFSILGVSFAQQADVSFFVASLLGVITGTFGGVMGDVICNEIPSLFRSAPLYATCSFAGCWVYLLLTIADVRDDVAVWGGVATVVVSRLVSVRWNLRLPTPKAESRAEP